MGFKLCCSKGAQRVEGATVVGGASTRWSSVWFDLNVLFWQLKNTCCVHAQVLWSMEWRIEAHEENGLVREAPARTFDLWKEAHSSTAGVFEQGKKRDRQVCWRRQEAKVMMRLRSSRRVSRGPYEVEHWQGSSPTWYFGGKTGVWRSFRAKVWRLVWSGGGLRL